jgi:N-acyl-D-amino-acid deacylase
MRGTDPENTILDLVLEDQSRVGTVYFLMDEEEHKETDQAALGFVRFGCRVDGSRRCVPEVESSIRGLTEISHGFFGKYVRDENVISLQEAIRRLTSLPAGNLGLDRRGTLKKGFFADVVIFDPNTIADRATFEKPHQFAVGVRDVFVNGIQMLKTVNHTGKFSGRALYGPGKVKE